LRAGDRNAGRLATLLRMSKPSATGRCVCGAIQYELHGELRGILVCHCVECRRYHGTSGAYTAVAREGLVVRDPEQQLRWFPGPTSETGGERGFCARCGSSLLWREPGKVTTSVSAGSLDGETGLSIARHIWDEQRADWEPLDDLPRSPRGS
jgi:hypothetical protein